MAFSTCSRVAFTKTPTLATKGGNSRMMLLILSFGIKRELPSKNMKPNASAPAVTAAMASATLVIPQTLIFRDMVSGAIELRLQATAAELWRQTNVRAGADASKSPDSYRVGTDNDS